jgi:membrane-associated protein
MGQLKQLLDLFLHLNLYLEQIILRFGTVTYLLLFLVIFAETGFVVTPFLPGDSLIFAAGAFAAKGLLNPIILYVALAAAAILGDTINYWIGHFVGERAYTGEVRWIKKDYMLRTHAFFQKHGGKTIFLARFVPIVRTFAPFVAGAGQMDYKYFFSYNVFGGLVWVGIFLAAGYFFGTIPIVQQNFELVIVVIVLISVMPAIWEMVRARREKKQLAKSASQNAE